MPCAHSTATRSHPLFLLQAEYERVKAAYTDMSASLESLSTEKRRLEAQLAQMEADGRRNERERRSLEQQASGRRWFGGCRGWGGVGWAGQEMLP